MTDLSQPAPVAGSDTSLPQTQGRKPLHRWTVPAVAALVFIFAVAALVFLWQWIESFALINQKEKLTAQLDTVKIAASILVAGGGLFALYLAARRQRTLEEELQVRRYELTQRDRTQIHTEQDATARRVTELYTKAAEQLGHEQAPVRLSGAYALERLAQEHPDQRQPVISVLCAYLRMPYFSDSEPDSDFARVDAESDRDSETDLTRNRQEREVRLTIQRIVSNHAHCTPQPNEEATATYWGNHNPAFDIDVDLTGATLVDLNLAGRRLHPSTDFTRARFEGESSFCETTFTGYAKFNEAKFIGNTSLVGAHFCSGATFRNATFFGKSTFRNTKFTGENRFSGAKFMDYTSFREAHFACETWFREVKFTKDAWFYHSSFASNVWFYASSFAGRTCFDNAQFAGTCNFREAEFTEEPVFCRARGKKGKRNVWPSQWELDSVPAGITPNEHDDWREVAWTGSGQVPTLRRATQD